MSVWLIPVVYLIAGVVLGFVLPRFEYEFLPSYGHAMSVASAQAYLSAVASGMMTLTAIVFSIAFVMMQFSTSAYSKRLVLLFAENPVSSHALGTFFATFMFALGTLEFVDRDRDGKVPMLSVQVVIGLLAISMIALVLLVRRISSLQITHVLRFIGDKGRSVIAATFPRSTEDVSDELDAVRNQAAILRTQAPTQRVVYSGLPQAVASFRVDECISEAQRAGGVLMMSCAIGDTVVEGTLLLEVYAASSVIRDSALLRCIVFAPERTFEQDPKYPLRLLVDTAIMALSPAVNDPTTAVQAIDQIEDLLHRLGRRVLDVGFVKDAKENLRLVFPTPTWEEYLSLGFDEIRMYGASSIQVLRRLRAALMELTNSLTVTERVEAVRRYLDHLSVVVDQSALDPVDRALALEADPQGLGHTRR